eukprot:CAMPEP_0119003392 /NCGR_PEP_ID=MMETSP1176-20130426/536_1 /TAXON_ID=265551 /ORGANISM="Synedropsis recta cf, Strain CCMP1620" /LENGTH=72 /DNA_ID=CAMNT_0006954991 /DNA_START=43 /DNA_END=258 /DNA_ORIENTATION=+
MAKNGLRSGSRKIRTTTATSSSRAHQNAPNDTTIDDGNGEKKATIHSVRLRMPLAAITREYPTSYSRSCDDR